MEGKCGQVVVRRWDRDSEMLLSLEDEDEVSAMYPAFLTLSDKQIGKLVLQALFKPQHILSNLHVHFYLPPSLVPVLKLMSNALIDTRP